MRDSVGRWNGLRARKQALLLDAVASQEDFVRDLVERGWNIERPFQRMRFGDAGSHGHELPFAVAGPEYG